MKKYYRYGELLLALREEYKGCRELIEKLNKIVKIKGNPKEHQFYRCLSSNIYI